jgi:hypothetical protein
MIAGFITSCVRLACTRIHHLVHCHDGHMALMAALLTPMLVGVAGSAIDVSAFLTHRTNLQSVADAAALAAAKEASLNGWSKEAAAAVVHGLLEADRGPEAATTVVAKIEIDASKKEVKVFLEEDRRPYFMVGYFVGSPQIVVWAKARTNSVSNICVIGLEGSDPGAVALQDSALISAEKCAVYANSLDVSGLASTGNAELKAQLACAAGGFAGMPRNFNYQLPLTDCPAVADPLASRPEPAVGTCREKDADYSHFIGSLQPGVYCGGLTIRANSDVTLRPGIYIIKDGPLVVESSSSVNAKGVGFFFTGDDARLVFGSDSSVDIEAPTSGPLAGITMFQERAAAEADFVITSNGARKLIGTIYLPNGNLIINANSKVADESAYTAIVVRRLQLSKGPNLVLNTDYDRTLVPVPEGVGPQASTVNLVH